MPRKLCKNCGHAEGWHLVGAGGRKLPCNKPGCNCNAFEEDDRDLEQGSR